MPSLLTSTQQVLDGQRILEHCNSRSLRLTRYAVPGDQEIRRPFLDSVVDKRSERHDVANKAYDDWLKSLPSSAQILHARLTSRLLINMAGSVLENAGLNLDRYGTAYISGSAVKACARRTALAALRQWCETGVKPSATACDALAPACCHASFITAGDLLLAILRVFGCADLEWQDYDYDEATGNDVAWACADQWTRLRESASTALNPAVSIPNEAPPSRRGAVAFLPAYPAIRPAADLEIDVLTGHHAFYYGEKEDGMCNLIQPTATDTEKPIPVFFPAVAAEAEYAFALLPVGKPDSALISNARTWLATGLTVFGLGAKTAAGYGVFTDITGEVLARETEAREAAQHAAEQAALKAKLEAGLAARKAREVALATMSPEQRADAELADRSADWGWMKPHLGKFPQHPPVVQAALLRWLTGAGRDRWLSEIKPDAASGKKPWSQIIGAIHVAKKAHKIELP